MQIDSKVCPKCRGADGQGAPSVQITDSTVGEISHSVHDDHSMRIAGDVSGNPIDSEILNIGSINIQNTPATDLNALYARMDALLEAVEIGVAPSGSEPTALTPEQIAAAKAVSEKLKEDSQYSNNTHGDPDLFMRLGWAAFYSGDISSAKNNFETSKTRAESLGDASKAASSEIGLGEIDRLEGDKKSALQRFRRARRVFEELNDRKGIAISINNIALIHHANGEDDVALDLHQKSISINEELGDEEGVAKSLNALGNVLAAQGESDAALDAHQRSLAISRERDNQMGMARSLHNIAGIRTDQGDADIALELLGESLVLDEALGNQKGIAISLTSIGSIYVSNDQPNKALPLYSRALGIFKDLGATDLIGQLASRIGWVHKINEHPRQALEMYQYALTIREEQGDESLISILLGRMGDIHISLGDLDLAIDEFERMLEIRESIGSQRDSVWPIAAIASVHQKRGKSKLALAMYERSLEIEEEFGSDRNIAVSLSNVGDAYLEIGNLNLALSAHERSLGIQEDLSDRSAIAKCLGRIASVHEAIVDPDHVRLAACNFDINASPSSFLDQEPLFEEASLKFRRRALQIEEELGDETGAARTRESIARTEGRQYRFNSGPTDENLSPEPGTSTKDSQTYHIATIGGSGEKGFGGDGGSLSGAIFNDPRKIRIDAAGNLFIADTGNNRIRMVDSHTGIITTVGGNGAKGFSGDNGPATAAQLKSPEGIAIDHSGNIYVADTGNKRVRRINRETGIIESVAGKGGYGNDDKDLLANETNMQSVNDLVFDHDGNLIIVNKVGGRIKRLTVSTGMLITLAGAGTGFWEKLTGDAGPAFQSGLGGPEAVVVDASGNVIIADSKNARVRSIDPNNQVIQTIVGTTDGFAGDGGPAINCKLTYIDDLALDEIGNLYILDGGTQAYDNHRIRRVDAVTGIISTIVGNGDRGFSGDDGPPLIASIRAKSIAISPSGDLYIADTENHRIRIVRGIKR